MVKFIFDQLTEFQPRDDYKELLQLSLYFLGEKLPEKNGFKKPGACHRARWMSKIIYSIKIVLFCSQFELKDTELSNLEHFTLFIMRVYLKPWFTSTDASGAPRNDSNFIKNLNGYKNTSNCIYKLALKVFSGHLWYLSDTLIGLAFFDNRVSDDIKLKMVKSLDKIGTNVLEHRIKIPDHSISNCELNDLVTNNTHKLFTALNIKTDFLTTHPSTWKNSMQFLDGYKKLKAVKVVNDAAERGIALMTSFNGTLTNQEEQQQYILQVIEKHRKDFPDSKKTTLLQM